MKDTRHIYVLLTDTGTWFTKLIRVFTRAPMNHASIALDRELTEVFSFGRKKRNNPWVGGFVKEDMTSDMFEQASCALYCCDVDQDTYERICLHIRAFEQNKHRYTYNLLGLFGVLLNTRIPRKDAYFCTQFVASVLMQNGIPISSKPPELVTPTDLEKAHCLKPLYRGSLGVYRGGLEAARTVIARLATA
ncbi:hypothetical protein [Paenibacillus sp. GCM10027626]|uniref:hypothetical protein n=1 Tax=Paenibacillus sp. GCM10027626 TaxID=3273411 RepID=UPI00363A5852